jgi:hypothetical protein
MLGRDRIATGLPATSNMGTQNSWLERAHVKKSKYSTEAHPLHLLLLLSQGFDQRMGCQWYHGLQFYISGSAWFQWTHWWLGCLQWY